MVLWFSSWAALFSLFLLFVPHLPSWDAFLMPIIIIFLSWDLSHSPYAPSNPYTVPCITAGQGIFFASLFLVMDAYSSSRFSRISYICIPLTHLLFHDIPWLSTLTQQNILPSFTVFFCLFSRSLPEYISPRTCTYSLLLICAIYASHFPCLESLAPRPNPPSPLVNLVAPELTKLLITSISLHPTLKGSLLLYLDCLQCLRNTWPSCISQTDIKLSLAPIMELSRSGI